MTYPLNDDDLADRLREDLDRLDNNDAEWREITLNLCLLFAEGRRRCDSNQAFRLWLFERDLIERVSHQDRAAYIKAGEDMEKTRILITETKNRSIRTIVEVEWPKRFPETDRLTSSGKTTLVETNISETISSVPQEAVTVISPIVESIPVVAAPLTQPSNPTLTLKTKHVQPSTPSRGSSGRKHPIETYFKDKTVTDTIFKLWGRRGNHSAVTLSRLSEKPANRPMVLKMIEVVKANNWTPIQGAQGLAPSILHSAFKGKGTVYKETPTGIQACIDEALEIDRKLRGVVDPAEEARRHEAYQAMLARLKASTSPTSMPTDAGDRFNTPTSDEDIVVYGTVIREKGTHPEVYQDWWQGASLIFHILEVFGPLKPDQLRNVGHTLNTARHWLRGINVAQLELVLGEVGNAMLAAKDETGRLASASARVRHADKK
jgi:hypothetical protein